MNISPVANTVFRGYSDHPDAISTHLFRFDPKKIKYMPVTQVELRPELAKVGLDIRVVGYVSIMDFLMRH